MAYVTEETFVEGLRALLRRPRLGQRRAGGPDVGGRRRRRTATSTRWTDAWLDRAGTDTISLVGTTLLASSPDGGEPRRHALRIGSYTRTDGGLERTRRRCGWRRPAPRRTSLDLPVADLHLLNDGDLTFASVRTDESSLQVLLAERGPLPEPVNRALAVGTAWDMLLKGELSTGDFLDCVLRCWRPSRAPAWSSRSSSLALRAAEQWSPTVLIPRRLARLAEVAAARADDPEHRTAALHTLAWAASTPEHFDAARRRGGRRRRPGLAGAWSVAPRSAGTTRTRSTALLERDPDPDAHLRACGVSAARPVEEAKAEAWERFWRDRDDPGRARRSATSRAASGGRSSTSCWSRGRTATSTRSTALTGGGLLAAGRHGPAR